MESLRQMVVGDTIDANSVGSAVGSDGGGIDGATHVTAKGTIVSGNTLGGASGNCDHAVASSSYSVEGPAGSTSCGFTDPTDLPSADPLLQPLADNGGPTQTQALGAGSPAIDVVPAASCSTSVDQRGFSRPDNGETVCDVGAFEVQDPVGCAGSGASFVSPASFESGVSSSTSLSWCPAAASSYYLLVGTSPGAGDVVSAGLPGSQTSYAVALPAGRTLFATLYTYPASGGGAVAGDVVFGTAPAVGQAAFISPSSFQDNVPSATALSWSAPAGGASRYYLTVGTSPGGGDVVTAALAGSQTSLPVSLPAGRTLYATLWAYPAAGGAPTPADVVFHTAYAATSFTNPAAFATSVPTSTTISWTSGPGAGSYYLTVGTSPGAADVVNSGGLPASQTSFPATLPPGRTLYATLWTYPAAGGGPTPTDIAFSTDPAGPGPARDRTSAHHPHKALASSRAERSAWVSMMPVSFIQAGASDPGSEFAGHAGKAFGEFHQWVEGPFKAGKLDPTKVDKQAGDKAIATAAQIAQETKLAKQAAAQDNKLAPLAALLEHIQATVVLIPPDLKSDSPSTKAVELAAMQYIDARITQIEAAAKQAGQPITETNE